MSWGLVAVGGATIIGGFLANDAAKNASDTVASGSAAAAGAANDSAEAQLTEVQRQFNYQQEVLQPQIQRQNLAGSAFSDLLGLGNVAPQNNPANALSAQQMQQINQTLDANPGFYDGSGQFSSREDAMNYMVQRDMASGGNAMTNPAYGATGGGQAGTSFGRGADGSFVDPNLSTTKLANTSTYGNSVKNSLQAGTSAANDPFRKYVGGNSIADTQQLESSVAGRQLAGNVNNDGYRNYIQDNQLADNISSDTMTDLRSGVSLADQRGGESLYDQRSGVNLADGAAGVGVYGDTFQESAGYDFQVEEMNRALQYTNSAGGNFGGAAIEEAMRRAQGLANTEYYNWAAGRTNDLQRLGTAEASDVSRDDSFAQYDIGRGDSLAQYDIGRGDSFAQYDLNRGDATAQYDIGRGDSAYENFLQREALDAQRMDGAVAAGDVARATDVQRGDAAYENYLQRKAGDASRLDSAALNQDSLQQYDLQRSDQSYYNYLQNLSGVAGFSNASGQAVQGSQAQAQQVGNVYANQGNTLSNLYQNNANTQASIGMNQSANINNSIQSGFENYLTLRSAA